MKDLLEEVYQTHQQAIFSLALAITGSTAAAEDSVHDAIENLLRRRVKSPSNESFRDAADLAPYVFRAVRNAAIDASRKRNRSKEVLESVFNGFHPMPPDESPDQAILSMEQKKILRDAIDELPRSQREAVVVKALSELTFAQAAAALDISPKTLATRYRRALIKLESRLRGEHEES